MIKITRNCRRVSKSKPCSDASLSHAFFAMFSSLALECFVLNCGGSLIKINSSKFESHVHTDASLSHAFSANFPLAPECLFVSLGSNFI